MECQQSTSFSEDEITGRSTTEVSTSFTVEEVPSDGDISDCSLEVLYPDSFDEAEGDEPTPEKHTTNPSQEVEVAPSFTDELEAAPSSDVDAEEAEQIRDILPKGKELKENHVSGIFGLSAERLPHVKNPTRLSGPSDAGRRKQRLRGRVGSPAGGASPRRYPAGLTSAGIRKSSKARRTRENGAWSSGIETSDNTEGSDWPTEDPMDLD